ncbi:uncharacterized protein LOC121267581 isoform X1 [Juglans microcarpa x Juglans regia]|uniref:uncharacterized protein LOC121267581 isoform X1 n=2 Tax=Juglans microcarpa x Juglans regia TaxID=2249226 RepID=UPI001B7E4909|nr:uncharacterized protein LOC121267581 isoform X1 [Juglans microcarpa x Juglans regia]XP_041027438.1 uncharacterized protein LOC121267581 isoform X1 [Juglans microcarpa x Juglans regia]XP_041027439.1 uncharacterized protein LOC121267581 isoform X1 [Juglans microcarpa x Juglans regia]XP_041027440.1 uncharacterized protein LOC121267581 isoform X1 [Juglans microcarpa x Juglans regia]XP_041027441.1 uncharacterized protein LOC121267581 isoform X1 [Juglans microcarpa x Juglans regia]XP_041027442.1 
MLGKRKKLSKGGSDVTEANAFKEVVGGIAKTSHSKRQRVDFGSSKNRFGNSELSHELQSIFLPDGRDCVARLNMECNGECPTDLQSMKSCRKDKTYGEYRTCIICKHGGKLLCCVGKGCKRRYHISCLDPPLNDVPPGVWHCVCCVKRKIELGVHFVSKEIESIWDVREVASDHDVLQCQKQYMVKYHGFAHVHNCWIQETQLLLEAPKLVTKFNKKRQVVRWRAEWTVPHRLVHKRMILFPKQCDEFHDGNDDNNPDCCYEWLVKWTGLGYEHATWELDNASFFTSPEAMKLMSDYESRHEKAEIGPHKADEEGKPTFHELSEFSFGDSPAEHSCHLNFVNNLREHWHKGQNAIVFDDHADQERVVKVILFILSLQLVVQRPFLVISTSTALPAWEAEFLRLAPCANIIYYKGNKEVRSSIRSLEFYNEGGRIMFNVLLSTADVAVEDFQVLECIGWEAIIIDECQRSKMSRHSGQIRMLPADMRLLLISGEIKDCRGDYLNMLSLLESGYDGLNSERMETNSNTDISKLKKRLAQYIASECKSSSRFVEYWVPVQLSNVQLEQYCASLLSNSVFLSSCLKSGTADALRDVIISARKCCDHPYLLDRSLQSFVTKDLPIDEYLDVGIELSGKLKALDKILVEIKNRGLRVLILFQSIGGSGRDSVGDILVDFVHQRFGKDSYVSLDGRGYAHSKKQAALNMFNDKENEKFVFLIEIRACLPSIRLSAVDTIILFGSDWDPQNDLRALHRISISSQFEQLKVFRLYTSCTLEEKVLILAKEGMALDSNIHSTNPRTYDTLLRWGASYLFNKLDDFHSCSSSVSGSNISPEQSLLGDVMHELSTQLPYSGDNNDPHSCLILKVEHGGGGYARNLSLFGEREMQFVNDEPPTFFWKNLLEGRDTRWNFLSGSSQRVRRKVHYLNDSPKESEFERSAVIKKSRKLFNNKLDTIYLKSKSEDERKLTTANKAAKIADNVDDLNQALGSSVEPPVAINKISQVSEIGLVESEEQNIQLGVCQSFPPPEISELCEILQLPVNVKDTAVRFLEYGREKFNLSGEGISTLQAFRISLCWVAASLSEHSIDHIESIALAKLHLNYVCKEAEVDYIYSKLEKIKKSFACCLEKVECVKEHCAKASKSTTSNQQDVVEGKTQRGYKSHPLSDLFEPATVEQTPDMVKNDSSNIIKDVLDNVDTKMEKCKQNQQKEVQEFHKKKMEEKAKLEEAHRLESALIRTKHSDISVRLDKLRLLDHNLKEKIDEHNHQMEIHLKTLEASQLAPRFEEQQIKAIVWLGKPKSGVPTAISDNPSWSDLELKVGRMQPSDIAEIDDGSQNAAPKGIPSFQNQNDSGSMPSYPAEVPEFSNVEKISCSFPMEAENVSIASDAENNGSEVMALKWATTTCVEQHNKVGSRDGPRNGAPVLGSSDLESSVCNVQTLQSIEGPSEVAQTLSEAIMRHEPMKMLPNTVQPNGVCPDKDAVTLDSTADTQDRRQDGEVMAIFGDSACSEFNGTWPSLVQTDTCPAQGSSLASHQPISTNPSSTEYNSLPASLGNLLVFSNLLHSAICLPLPSSIDIPAGRSEHVADRSRTTVPGPLIDHPHAVLPEMPQPVCLNPLQIEMERIQKDKEQALKRHQDMILQLRYKCDKEIEEIRKKYDLLLQDAETSLMQKQRDLETFHYKVNLNKELADALIVKSHGAIGSVYIEQAALSSFTNEWIQLSSQQPHQMTAPRQQRSASPEINIPPVAPPAVVDRTSAVLSTLGTPHSSFMIPYPRNLQNGIELRAPAPHLRASPSMQAVHVSTTRSGTPNQSPRNPLATSVKLARSIKAPPEV